MLEKSKEKNQERKKQENLHLGQKDNFSLTKVNFLLDFFRFYLVSNKIY